MSLSDWLLFLHVVSAFAVFAALVVFWIVGLMARGVDRPGESLRYFRIVRPATALVGIGMGGTLVFGIWIAIERSEYQLWDAWIVAALVLWAVFGRTGQQGGVAYSEAQKLAARLVADGRDEPSAELRALLKDRRAIVYNAVTSLVAVALLVDMIYKPGA